MNLIFRMLWVLVIQLIRKKCSPFEPIQQRFTVLPNDLDTNLHMNNGRYLTIMDLGRFALILRTGMAKFVWKEKWQPLIGSSVMSFRKGLKPLTRYTLTTHIRHWDERWFFIEQRFMQKGTLMAVGYVKGCMYNAREKRIMPVAEVMHLLNIPLPQEVDKPEFVENWLTSEEGMFTEAMLDTRRAIKG